VLAFAIDREVDFVGITGELGAWKPDAAAFHKVLEQLGVAPHRATMVGDSVDFDLVPAKALGMQTVQVGGIRHAAADHHVATPGQLVALLPAALQDAAATAAATAEVSGSPTAVTRKPAPGVAGASKEP
jgi:FMN phosphatase YigB (HAD superfamily)